MTQNKAVPDLLGGLEDESANTNVKPNQITDNIELLGMSSPQISEDIQCEQEQSYDSTGIYLISSTGICLIS